jgi:hypothetical protein
MKQNHHVRELVETNVDVPSGSCHPASNRQELPTNPWDNYFSLKSTLDLPAEEAKPCFQRCFL